MVSSERNEQSMHNPDWPIESAQRTGEIQHKVWCGNWNRKRNE